MKKEASASSTLLVLGAGASIGAAKYPIESSLREAMAQMPSGPNFFHDLFFQGRMDTHDERYVNSLGLTYEGLNDLIVRAWALDKNRQMFDPNEWKQINVEEVFTFLDIGERMYPQGSRYQKGFQICRKSLRQFITTSLAVKSEGFHCEHLMHILFALKPTDSIISFNWDTIADFTLQFTRRPIYKGYLDLMKSESLRISDFTKRGVLLKLHGSLNWIVCPNTRCSLHGKIRLGVKGGKLQRFMSLHTCPKCGSGRGEPFIIPPTSNKLIKQGSFIHKLWLIARNKLPYTKRIIFIGYSFPLTDFYSEWLFRQIYFLQEHRPEIVVVNPEMKKPDSAVAKRYRSLFKGCKIDVYGTLEEFRSVSRDLLNH
jgi:hypothetical protein